MSRTACTLATGDCTERMQAVTITMTLTSAGQSESSSARKPSSARMRSLLSAIAAMHLSGDDSPTLSHAKGCRKDAKCTGNTDLLPSHARRWNAALCRSPGSSETMHVVMSRTLASAINASFSPGSHPPRRYASRSDSASSGSPSRNSSAATHPAEKT